MWCPSPQGPTPEPTAKTEQVSLIKKQPRKKQKLHLLAASREPGSEDWIQTMFQFRALHCWTPEQ
ncbi:hypothetical protein JMJ77_0009631 [Colletotrichum scovillei]|uniref:Uncharacterized protein n=1 Tax=Colletotrichum scovillei TaxID=1209932 RepID=A0A9P7U9I0_9PEZI|nr:hypothetical protein JMJ77_0009631 [Colletotrichum scovillei]KAG7052711.1 hypothetical protein JMJ78_0005725 [Colletotrichum scovillei]KAG7065004.1 hypothetical protein JMJ76_0012759 [Colletotrichum scovillei]